MLYPVLIFIIVNGCFVSLNGYLIPVKDEYIDIHDPRAYSKLNISFHLYNNASTSEGNIVEINNEDSLMNAGYDSNLPVIFIIHDWDQNHECPWVQEMLQALLAWNSWNIFVVDWASIAHRNYTESKNHANIIGELVAKMSDFLVQNQDLDSYDIQILGLGFGAHIAGFAGERILNGPIGRITGLDPARKEFEWPTLVHEDNRLDKKDALFVEIVHSNPGGLGFEEPLGHVDIYINDGEQPGCGSWICSHVRACEYWTESIKVPELFKAFRYSETLDSKLEKLEQGVPVGFFQSKQGMKEGQYYLKSDLFSQDNVDRPSKEL